MKQIFLLISTLLITVLAYSQDVGDSTAMANPGGEWIDSRLADCLKAQNITTIEQNDCLYTALEQWEKQLSDTYSLVVSQVDEPAKSALKSSQTAWLTYKNGQFKFLEQYYGNMQGTMYKQVMITEKIEVIKRRFAELYNLTQD